FRSFGAVVLNEGVQLGVEAVSAHICMDVLPQAAPALGRTGQPKFLERADRAVKCNPRHDFGMRELSPSPADFPKPLVRQVPDPFEMLDQLSLEVPSGLARRQSHPACLVKRIEHLAIDIQLKLVGGRIADPHWCGVLITAEPAN